MFLYPSEEIGVCNLCGAESAEYGYRPYSDKKEFTHQKCLAAERRPLLMERVLKGVAIFNQACPDWRDKLRERRPDYIGDIPHIVFGHDEARNAIPELVKRIQHMRKSGRGSMRGTEESFFHEIGVRLYAGEIDDGSILMSLWMEFAADASH